MEPVKRKVAPGEAAVVSQQFRKEEAYWLERFSGKLEKSSFPFDYRKRGAGAFFLASQRYTFGEVLSDLIEKLSQQSDVKRFMVLCTGLVILLSKYTGKEDIIVGVPIFKQQKEGEFVNTVLGLRTQVTGDMTFKELLLQVRKAIIEADENQNYSIEMIIRKLKLPFQGQEFPLFDHAVLLETIHDRKYLEQIKFQMMFSFFNEKCLGERAGDGMGVGPGTGNGNGNGMGVDVEYNTRRYLRISVDRVVQHYMNLLETGLGQLELKVSELEVLTEKEKVQILMGFNDNSSDKIQHKTLYEQFEQQVEKTPHKSAVIFENNPGNSMARNSERKDYLTLFQKVWLLGEELKQQGAAPGVWVGIMVTPSIDMVTGLLAILKTGAAYLPLDSQLPWERIQYMLKDSATRILMVDKHTKEKQLFTSLQGIGGGKKKHVKQTGLRHHIKEFDALPMPDRSLIRMEMYKGKIGMASVTDCITLQTTRGCPYYCLFCHKIWSKHHVHRSAENIFIEIEYYYHKKGVTNFAVIDDCFNLSDRSSKRLFQMILQAKMKIQIFFPNGLRGDILTPEYIDLMVEAGTRGINLSLETASPRLQKLLRKNLDLEKFREVVEYIATQHPGVILEMATMHGFPTETEEEALMTLDFIKGIKWLHFPYIHILKIFPNTEMEQFALENGISKKDILISKDRAFHELPETLPFSRSFTRQYQAGFLNDYFLNKERLSQVLPAQMKVLSEEALVQKYNAYLPVEIKNIRDLVEFVELDELIVPANDFALDVTGTARTNKIPTKGEYEIRPYKGVHPTFPDSLLGMEVEGKHRKTGARRILLLDLSQHFSTHQMLYRVVEQPLGLIYLMTWLNQRFGEKVQGRIYKSGIDFDSFEELRQLLEDFSPEFIGIRTLTFFKEFFHETVSLIRQWGYKGPVVTGGPYASSDYETILQDTNVDLAVIGEGEYTLEELVKQMLDNDFQVPGPDILSQIKGLAFREPSQQEKTLNRQVLHLDESIESFSIGIPGTFDIDEDLNKDLYKEKRFYQAQLPAYVMYTSGSTGKPKGVVVEHRQVNNCISWMQDQFPLKKGDVVLQRTNLTFDPSVWEIFWPLSLGAGIRIADHQQRRDAEYLIQIMAGTSGVTMMYCPATLVTGITYLLESRLEKLRLQLPWLLIGAEPIQKTVIDRFQAFFDGRIVNTYGPTEGTINNTWYEIPPNDTREVVPIGKPIANNRIYILSEDKKIVPINVPGEIYLAGQSMARGYLNQPGKTSEAFVDNPFFLKGEKMYCTGDIGRWLEDGNIEILGRKDDQVKIRGYRIELGEIQNSLLRHDRVKECVVVVKDKNEGEEEVRHCKKCQITSKYPGIIIDDEGICNVCDLFEKNKTQLNNYFRSLELLEQEIRENNRQKKSPYDCLLLYSGGRGAAYALYQLKKMGIRVLAATYDHGYYGKGDLKHIREITGSLGVDHVVLTHPHSDRILQESLKRAHTVCRGCFLTSSALAAKIALEQGINVVVGATLSRGQIIENKLFMFLQQGIHEQNELEERISEFQKSIPEIEKEIFKYIDIEEVKDATLYDQVFFLDFYRYCNVSNQEMINYLNAQDKYWETRKTHAVYSTNCPIKQLGDYAFLEERGHHFYGSATSWEKRLGHLTAENLREDLNNRVTTQGFRNFSKRMNVSRPEKIEKEEKSLCAYIVAGKSNGKEEPSSEELRHHLREEIPVYMVPNYFMFLDKIPVTPNGKVDKQALPLPKTSRSQLGFTYVAPKSDLEKIIANLWEEVLKLDKSGINDNFFELGGNSLNIIEVNSKLQAKLEKDIPIVTMFTYPTIRTLAQYLEQENGGISKAEKEKNRKEMVREGKNLMKQTVKKITNRV